MTYFIFYAGVLVTIMMILGVWFICKEKSSEFEEWTSEKNKSKGYRTNEEFVTHPQSELNN